MAYSLTINGLLLDRQGFCLATDLTDLLQKGRQRGSDFVSLGVAGATFRPKVRDALVAQVGLEIGGYVDSTGTPTGTPGFDGILENAEAIEAACVAGSSSATVTATVTYPSGATRSGQVWCPELIVNMGDILGNFAPAVLEVVVPAGALT